MCGIFGIIGLKKASIQCLEGLSNLEYRGYDSAGIATIEKGQLFAYKHVGKVALLGQVLQKEEHTSQIALGHTRWATHGDVNLTNAHPHFDSDNTLMIVHNGIIENYIGLRKDLEDKGVIFATDTDSEVIAQLIAFYYKGDPIDAMLGAMGQLEGSYAIGLIHKDHPNKLFAMCDQMTLSIGLGEGASGISSDPHAFSEDFSKGFFLIDRQIALLDSQGCFVYDEKKELVFRKIEEFDTQKVTTNKEGYKHYMLKEIFEEPFAISNTFADRIAKISDEWRVENLFDRLDFPIEEFSQFERIEIIACGSSYNAAKYGADLLEEMGIESRAQIASEFRVKKSLKKTTLFIAISQSGETADTLSAVKQIRKQKGRVVAICNRMGSTIERISDGMMYMRVGVEMSVASTKTYVSSLTLLYLFTLFIAQEKKINIDVHERIEGLIALPLLMQEVLKNSEKIHNLAKKYANLKQFLFLGRKNLVYSAMEGALKLKEIAYSFSSAYPAGEMKHGPIALVDEDCLTIALCGHRDTFSKMMTSLMEVKTRKSKVLAFVEEEIGFVIPEIDVFFIPQVGDALSPFLATLSLHLFAYYIALERKLEIDRPRNLAKSVTVE